jgi:hypothetical protein
MKLIFRAAHYLLVLVLSALLISSVYYAFYLLWEEQHPHSQPPANLEGGTAMVDARKPSPQEIVSSFSIKRQRCCDPDGSVGCIDEHIVELGKYTPRILLRYTTNVLIVSTP